MFPFLKALAVPQVRSAFFLCLSCTGCQRPKRSAGINLELVKIEVRKSFRRSDTDADLAVTQLTRRVGRVAVNTWPTGVATSWSQQHGGPWPATSRPEATSVGAGGLARFVRPVSLQNATSIQLPLMLQPQNPWKLPRRLNGRLVPFE